MGFGSTGEKWLKSELIASRSLRASWRISREQNAGLLAARVRMRMWSVMSSSLNEQPHWQAPQFVRDTRAVRELSGSGGRRYIYAALNARRRWIKPEYATKSESAASSLWDSSTLSRCWSSERVSSVQFTRTLNICTALHHRWDGTDGILNAIVTKP